MSEEAKNTLNEEHQALIKDMQEGDLVTVKDMCKVKHCTIKNKKQQDLIHDLIVYSISCVLQQQEYRAMIKNLSAHTTVNKKIVEILKLTSFRKEFMNLASFQVIKRADLPHYMLIFGQDFDLCVKYSRHSLIQVLIADTYNLTLFEVPTIQVLTIKESLRPSEIGETKTDEPEVEIVQTYGFNSEIANAFKDVASNGFKDVIKFFLTQMNLPKEKQNQKKLDVLGMLLLSRMSSKIRKFKDDVETMHYKTAENWGVVFGEITQSTSGIGEIYTSHPMVATSQNQDILFYQKMICTFKNANNKQKKCEAVVYCQKANIKSNFSLKTVFDGVWDLGAQINAVYYVLLFTLFLGYIYGNKYCSNYEDDELKYLTEEPKTLVEQYCRNRDKFSLNIGVIFLCVAVLRAIYTKVTQKKARAQRNR